ncbi:MAG: type ISP restriction/modification enzyme, partial [Leptospiraceae bacterium]|nr:type ISP restriction/modification enzyme [Leptospiraceae bacterium]
GPAKKGAVQEIHNKTKEKAAIVLEIKSPELAPEKLYHVEKMRFAKIAGKTGREGEERSTIVFNHHITLRGIPLEAYDYVVNGKSAIEWIMERYQIKEDKDSGIVNDPNLWALETAKNPRYILDLLLRIVTVSVETMRLVQSLPAFEPG